jgi:hypothetical protein
MSLDIGAPARGMIETLNVGGVWGPNSTRTGGTWPGTIASGSAYQPTQPYDGPAPAIFCSSIPLIANIVFEGAQAHRMDGTLELYYVDRLGIEQGVSVAVIDHTMTDNCTAVINAILADPHLNNSVVSVVAPIEIVRDPEGIFREWAGSPWVWCTIRVPIISAPSTP